MNSKLIELANLLGLENPRIETWEGFSGRGKVEEVAIDAVGEDGEIYRQTFYIGCDKIVDIMLDKLRKPALCKCGVNEAQELHTCPYALAMNNNETLCTCCGFCYRQCTGDI